MRLTDAVHAAASTNYCPQVKAKPKVCLSSKWSKELDKVNVTGRVGKVPHFNCQAPITKINNAVEEVGGVRGVGVGGVGGAWGRGGSLATFFVLGASLVDLY